MHPSAVSIISKSVLLVSQLRALLIIIDPLKQMRTDLNKAKDILAVIQEIVLEYSFPSSGLSTLLDNCGTACILGPFHRL